MSESAIDNQTFAKILERLRSQAYTIDRAEPLLIPGHDLPLAWVLIATR
jgi:hypothetical protein